MILIDHIKEDWLYRLPYRLDSMKFRGLNRPAYTLICLVYYSAKALILLYLAMLFWVLKFMFIFTKFVLWDIWNWIFKIDQREWFQKLFPIDDEYDDYDEEYVEDEEPDNKDNTEDLPFCQLFTVGPDMCLLVDHVEMCPDEVAFIRVVDYEGYTPLYKRKVRRNKAGDRFIVFNSTNYYLDENKTQPVIRKDK